MVNTPTDKSFVFLVSSEASISTSTGTKAELGLIQSVTEAETNNNIYHFTVGTRSMQQITAGKYGATLDVEGKHQHGRYLEMMFGTANLTTSTGGDVQHVFVDIDSDILDSTATKSLNVETNFFAIEAGYELGTTDKGKHYTGCKVNTITLNAAVGQVLQWTSNIICSNVTEDTSMGTWTMSTLPVLEHCNTTISVGADSSEVEQTVVQDFSLTFEATLEEVEGLGSRTNQDIVENNFTVKFNYTKVFQDYTEYKRFLGGTSPSSSTPTASSLIFSANNGTTYGSGKRGIDCKISDIVYDSHDEPVQLNQKVIATFNGTGKLNYLYTTDNLGGYFA